MFTKKKASMSAEIFLPLSRKELHRFHPSSINMHRTRQSLRTLSRSLATQATASTSTSSYTPPIKSGVLPAYDQALAYISKDREQKLKQLEELKGNKEIDPATLEKLEVEAWSNDPETRWKANNGQGRLFLPPDRLYGSSEDFLRPPGSTTTR
jgi:hypothetical protein